MVNKVTDYSRFYSEEALRSGEVILRRIGQLALGSDEELVNLGGGMPNASFFPFEKSTMSVCDGTEITVAPKQMKEALQYGFTYGWDPFLVQLRQMTNKLHGPIAYEYLIHVTLGSQHGLSMAVDMLVNDNDYVIVPQPLYSTTLNILEPRRPRYLSIPTDAEGIIVSELKKTLSKWDPKTCRDQYSDVPKIMYINPVGCNPSGATMSTERKKEIYDIASEYNILILEDDPYYFIDFTSEDEFPTSFFKLDVDGRVLRFDSFSKVLSAGVRVGYLCGPTELINRISRKAVKSVIHAPTLIQVYISGLFDEWGIDKFLNHTKKVRDFYKSQRDLLVKAANKHLTGLCKWNVPRGGVFMWMEAIGVQDTWEMICERGIERKILLTPGTAFNPGNKPSSFLRLSYSMATEEQFDRGLKNLADLIREERKLQST